MPPAREAFPDNLLPAASFICLLSKHLQGHIYSAISSSVGVKMASWGKLPDLPLGLSCLVLGR